MMRLVEEKYPDELDVIEELKMGEIFNGTSLKLTANNNLPLVKKFSKIVREIASEIAAGQHIAIDYAESSEPVSPERQLNLQKLFGELAEMLEVTDTW